MTSKQQLTDPVYEYFPEALRLIVDSGAVTDTQFCEYVGVKYLATAMEPHHNIRGDVLNAVCGMPPEQGKRKSSVMAESMLVDALDPSVDTARTAHHALRQAITWHDWPMVIGKEKCYGLLVIEEWYEETRKGIDELMVAHLSLIDEHSLLAPEEKLSALLDAGCLRRIPTALKDQLLETASICATTRQINHAESILSVMTNEVIVKALGPSDVVKYVFGKVAVKYHLVKETPSAKTGVTLTPVAFPAPQQAEPVTTYGTLPQVEAPPRPASNPENEAPPGAPFQDDQVFGEQSPPPAS